MTGHDDGESAAIDALYRDPQTYELLAQMTAPADLSFYRALLGDAAGRVLELGCGTGRLSLPLARHATEMTGLDNAPAMLVVARHKAAAVGSTARFEQADFRRFELQRCFDWVLLPYNALNHVCDAADFDDLFESVGRHLAPDGRFVVDSFQPDPAALARPRERRRLLTYLDPYRNQRITLSESSHYDAARRVNHITWHYDLVDQPDWRIHRTTMRILFGDELDALFRDHGFVVSAKYGHYDRSPFGPRSPKQLVVAKRA
ncbi:MAG: class I SAM-dependent methyltransferase [Zoogloeaceae bacterium]|nr:class I SAM-dependent methyltransferase [Rhodocyclaceae bacterium]MCP5235096.1 class I SAM-dependent methyltransferase [Zoogloeaceae bacterium]